MFDWFKLRRFVTAQESIYSEVLRELAAGRKTSHWMWFVFPQLSGLGRSDISKKYGLAGKEEARAYWEDTILGDRLRECVALLLLVDPSQTAYEIMGSPDDLKLHSCLTLFSIVAPEDQNLQKALARFYAGKLDSLTLGILRDESR